MKHHGIATAFFLTCLVSSQTTQTTVTSWRTNNGDFSIENIQSHSISGNMKQIEVDFRGNTLRGVARPQNLEFQAQQLQGTLAQNDKNNWYLEKGRLIGNIFLTVLDTNNDRNTIKTQQLDFSESVNQSRTTLVVKTPFEIHNQSGRSLNGTSAQLVLASTSAHRTLDSIILNGKFTVIDKKVSATRNSEIYTTGTSATIQHIESAYYTTLTGETTTTYQSSDKQNLKTEDRFVKISFRGGRLVSDPVASARILQEADLRGPIAISGSTWVRISNEFEQMHFTVHAQALTFDKNGIMRLSGNVRFNLGGDHGIAGTADLFTVRFDEQFNILNWESKGGPAIIKSGEGG